MEENIHDSCTFVCRKYIWRRIGVMKCVSNVKTWIREYNFFEREFKNLIYEKMNNQFISDEKYSLDINFETLISERIY